MIPQTIGEKYDVGRIAPVQCLRRDPLEHLHIRDNCFLLLILRRGSGQFRVGQRTFEASAPSLLCFDERYDPQLLQRQELVCDAVYFHPTFLNVNMTFQRVRSGDYAQIAQAHDLFLLAPFTDEERWCLPMTGEVAERMNVLFDALDRELREQRDWYWSCRSRACFMEMMLHLERLYQSAPQEPEKPGDMQIRQAVAYIEERYTQNIRLEQITKAAMLNHTTLTLRFKRQMGMTPVEYLWKYRITVAKKHLEFTNLPIKDVALRCGFKTVQHFSRRFEEVTGKTPATFRTDAVTKRKAEL